MLLYPGSEGRTMVLLFVIWTSESTSHLRVAGIIYKRVLACRRVSQRMPQARSGSEQFAEAIHFRVQIARVLGEAQTVTYTQNLTRL